MHSNSHAPHSPGRRVPARRISRLLAAVTGLVLAAGCATTIPESDTTSPEVELRITGPGIGSPVMSNPPREVWRAPDGTQFFDMEPDTTYRFSLVVSDEGGVARATLAMPSDFAVTELAD